jgi:hypothetical protein
MCQWIPNSRTSLKIWQIRSRNSMTMTAWWHVCWRKSPLIGQLTFQRSMCWVHVMMEEVELRQPPLGSAWAAPFWKRHRNCSSRRPSWEYHRLPWVLPWRNHPCPLTTLTIRWWYLIGAWHSEDKIILITNRILINPLLHLSWMRAGIQRTFTGGWGLNIQEGWIIRRCLGSSQPRWWRRPS